MQKGGSSKPTPPTTKQPRASPISNPSPSPDGPQPMILDTVTKKLTSEERARRICEKLCLYCGGSGHAVSNCPNSKHKVVAIVTPTPSISGKDQAQP